MLTIDEKTALCELPRRARFTEALRYEPGKHGSRPSALSQADAGLVHRGLAVLDPPTAAPHEQPRLIRTPRGEAALRAYWREHLSPAALATLEALNEPLRVPFEDDRPDLAELEREGLVQRGLVGRAALYSRRLSL